MAHRDIRRVLVIGLDCATPQLVFGPAAYRLPHLQGLAARGCWGRLESSHPPITVPAWASMTSGVDAGTLGLYGFRNRKDYSYNAMYTATAASVKVPRVWDVLSRAGKRVATIGVPQTYPVRPVNGWMVGCFLTPSTDSEYTYPRSLKQDIEGALGEYIIDVKDFRTDDKARLHAQLYAMLENRFAVARYILTTRPWDFAMMVEMGVDRLHHGFWRFCDPTHPRYQPGNPFADAMRQYYEAVDAKVGELLQLVGDETAVLVVSDHGAKGMDGGVCINEWLIREGLLTLESYPERPTRLEDCRIDWARTKVWGSGGYYGRLFFNVRGREPQGLVAPEEYETLRAAVIAGIEAMPGPDGQPLGNRAHRPQDLYRVVNGVAPDLLVYFGNLSWRSVGSVGFGAPGDHPVFTFENDTGPDDANHDFHGIFIMDDRTGLGGREIVGLNLMDVAPTVLDLLGVAPLPEMQGRVIGAGAAKRPD